MLRDRLIALVITLTLHILGVALLFWITLSSRVVSHTKEITLIPVGVLEESTSQEVAAAAVASSPAPEPVAPPVTTKPTPPTPAKEAPLVSHSKPEQTMPAPKPKPVEQPQETAAEREAREAKKAQEEERRRREEINRKVVGAFGKGGSKSQEHNGAEGNASQGKSIGSGFSLAGRSITGNGGMPARPTGFRPTRGTVVVRIVVNDEGRVIEASERLRGTNVTDPTTLQAAVRAAKATRFNPQPGTADQEGTITYHFDIQ
ncbi:energy transducer TonB family protein [Porphyromonas circumdentaria]|uniref:energy transducer TonB family protein n=1 Tax=Porphyromonas circumdentaria TaxID=29524 RepID=UPI0026DC2896|nr:energy transducer TonB [Porphyromonas circumdentaria]MDO4722390.1 TonB family protein [Porphyromonas circumdentaria]